MTRKLGFEEFESGMNRSIGMPGLPWDSIVFENQFLRMGKLGSVKTSDISASKETRLRGMRIGR